MKSRSSRCGCGLYMIEGLYGTKEAGSHSGLGPHSVAFRRCSLSSRVLLMSAKVGLHALNTMHLNLNLCNLHQTGMSWDLHGDMEECTENSS